MPCSSMGNLTILSPLRHGGGEDPSPSAQEEESVHSASVCELFFHDEFAKQISVANLKSGKKLLAGMAVLEVFKNVLQRAAVSLAHC